MSLNSLSTSLLATRKESFDSIRFQYTISKLALKRKWLKADELARQSRTKTLSELSTLEGLYRSCIIEKQKLEEKNDRAVKLGNKLLKNKKFWDLFENGDDLRKFKQGIRFRISPRNNPPELLKFSIISDRSQYLVAMGYTGFWGGFHSIFNRSLASKVPKPPIVIGNSENGKEAED
jgi:hypothetical protein